MATQEDPEELCGAPEDWAAPAHADAAEAGGDPVHRGGSTTSRTRGLACSAASSWVSAIRRQMRSADGSTRRCPICRMTVPNTDVGIDGAGQPRRAAEVVAHQPGDDAGRGPADLAVLEGGVLLIEISEELPSAGEVRWLLRILGEREEQGDVVEEEVKLSPA